MRRACVSTVRSPPHTLKPLPRGWAGGAQHRSDSVARSTPTRAQRRDTPKKYKKLNLYLY
ncbi:MAG: hypothetical protein NZ455_05900 [Bacteroidia bacterium]|nr:hypothetical protein [Bacteroidia bacterium]MDW8347442.1 hypothetical protein [Bacteroidia bacterium]